MQHSKRHLAAAEAHAGPWSKGGLGIEEATREPRQGCCQLTGKSERRGPWRHLQGVSLGGAAAAAHCPLLAILWGPWSLGDACLWVKKRRKGMVWECSPEGECALGPLSCGFFTLLCRWEPKGSSQGKISIEYSPAFHVCPFRFVVSTDWLVPGQGVFSQCSWS